MVQFKTPYSNKIYQELILNTPEQKDLATHFNLHLLLWWPIAQNRKSDDHDIFEVLNFAEKGADDRMIRGQSHDQVRKILELLPAEQREVIVLRHYADLSFKEIAEMTNCSINTALGRMRYGWSICAEWSQKNNWLCKKLYTFHCLL